MPRPLSVLLVEDDDPLRACLTEVFGEQGWQVHGVARGDDAVRLARALPIDFSVVDMHLPGMSGLDALRIITCEVRPLPWILMSGQATVEDTAAALRAGAFTFLRKPLDLRDLRR